MRIIENESELGVIMTPEEKIVQVVDNEHAMTCVTNAGRVYYRASARMIIDRDKNGDRKWRYYHYWKEIPAFEQIDSEDFEGSRFS